MDILLWILTLRASTTWRLNISNFILDIVHLLDQAYAVLSWVGKLKTQPIPNQKFLWFTEAEVGHVLLV